LNPEKHDDPRISTFRGISVDSSDERENVSNSIRVNFDWNSNNIDLIVLQSDSRFAAKTAVEPGIHSHRKQSFSSTLKVKHSSNVNCFYYIVSGFACSDRLE
jgi:2-keto-3-deoxy-galactonokinase